MSALDRPKMHHALENLDPERFQQLCQALLVAAFPKATMLPVGQPDGGRDAVQYDATDRSGFKVFQIKFSREAKDGKSAREWASHISDSEIEKAKRLVEQGANEYIFITNVQGTGHLDHGSIDTVRLDLEARLGIPVMCWWRDDLDRRLDSAWDIKLRYPEVLSGSDFLRLLLDREVDHGREERNQVLRTFLAAQYNDDIDVKFKQVDLHNKLLDLFVDLPFSINSGSYSVAHQLYSPTQGEHRVYYSGLFVPPDLLDDDMELGTAALLLGNSTEYLNQVVVEGAPGQGKSTLAQYLCQVHRIRILGRTADLDRLPQKHRRSPLRIPFKVDLRDLAVWLSGGDPFSKGTAGTSAETRSLETFLARLVSHHSGGLSFSAADLLKVSRLAPILIVLDGLDEVADVKRRADIVQSVTKAIPRLRENCPDARVIVTSRPAAFANSPGFDNQQFLYLELGSVTRTQINLYSERWISSKKLSDRERAEFREILDEKLERPHLRDLARNPMQLTILLTLIHTQGASLPDKRTTLYDDYVQLFFSRESSKSQSVRRNLQLLKDIHGFIAWHLHATAETDRNRGAGRISADDLRTLLLAHLRSEGHSTDILDDVFGAMLERVVMLVPKVEGTFEFEIQPLREYFAARYLYNTSSYSPVGRERGGTKPDRFDAISKNFYWLNVTRFFCGCFAKGELLDLADRVLTLTNDPDFKRSRHPFTLAAMLLSDYVFSQSPRATRQILECLMASSAIERLIPEQLPGGPDGVAGVLSQFGGPAMLDDVFHQMFGGSDRRDYLNRLGWLLRANWSSDRIDDQWLQSFDTQTVDFHRWLQVGGALSSIGRVSAERFNSSLAGSTADDGDIAYLLLHGRTDLALCASRSEERLFNIFMDGPPSFGHVSPEGPLYLLPYMLGSSFAFALRHSSGIGRVGRAIDEFENVQRPNATPDVFGPQERAAFELSCRFADAAMAMAGDLKEFRWRAAFTDLIERCRKTWGETPLILASSIEACLNGRNSKGVASDIFDQSISLVSRLSYARRQAKQPEWWSRQLNAALTSEEMFRTLLVFWRMASVSSIVLNQIDASRTLDGLADDEWRNLVRVFKTLSDERMAHDEPVKHLPVTLSRETSDRFALLMGMRDRGAYAHAVFKDRFWSDKAHRLRGRMVDAFRQRIAVSMAFEQQFPWEAALEIVRETYARGVWALFDTPRHQHGMPTQNAIDILDNSSNYPFSLWLLAQAAITNQAGLSAQKVITVARRDGWFSDLKR